MKKEHFLLAIFLIIIVVALILRISAWLKEPVNEISSNAEQAGRSLVYQQETVQENEGLNNNNQALLTPSASESEFLLGEDRDEHGCIGSAGYGWCETKQKCLRVWEEDCPPFLPAGSVEGQIEVAVSYPLPDDLVVSPLEIRGKARGYWFFEASLPVSLIAADGSLIASYYAQAEGEWMTADFVPFSSHLEFQTEADRGFLVIAKDNPSGLPQHDASIRIPVRFK